MIRATIYNALLTQIQGIRDAPYNLAVPVIELGLENAANNTKQPGLYVVPTKESSEYVRGLPLKWRLDVDVYLFTKKTPVGPGVYNALPVMDALELVLAPTKTSPTTGAYINDLGLTGVVHHCAIKGSSEFFGGYLDQQTIVRIPIEILTA